MAVHRRSPHGVLWPARLLWLPLMLGGAILTLRVQYTSEHVRDETWRVLVQVPGDWYTQPATLVPGGVLVVLGWLALSFQASSRPRGLQASVYPRLAMAAWLFFAIAALSTWRFEQHVASWGGGFDWRFLAHVRSTWVDRLSVAVSLAAGVACWIASWGRAPLEGGGDEEQRAAHEDPGQPAVQ